VTDDESLTENDDRGTAPDSLPPEPENATETSSPADDDSSPRLRLSWGGATHPGEIRPVNQDALFADRGLFVVADGMGGHQAGEVASRISVKTLAGRDHTTVDELVAGVTAANDAVWDHASSGPEFKGMGTTLTALAVIGDGRPPRLGLVNVGDSRAYRLRGGDFVQLTEDHSYVAELVRRGQITEADAETHPYRNMVTRALGVAATVEVDRWEMSPEAGDVFLLCSDGLVNELTDPAILEMLVSHDDPTESAKQLISAANGAGGRDNITVVIVRVDAEDPTRAEVPNDDHATSPLDTGVIAPVLPASATEETAEMLGLADQLEETAEMVGLTDRLEETAEMVGLPDQLEETTAALTALDEVGVELSAPDIEESQRPEDDEVPPTAEENVDPPVAPVNTLAAFDLPVLDGDEASLPWLTEASSDAGTAVESDNAADLTDPPPRPSGSGATHPRQEALPSTVATNTAGRPESDPTTPMAQFTDPVTAVRPVDHLDSKARGWNAPVAVTWRSLMFIAVTLGVIIGAGALLGWYARSAYYVGFSGDEVVVYQGRPDGVLWFDPTLEEGTGIFRQDLSDSINLQIEDLYETGTLAGARAFVDEIRPGRNDPDASGTGDAAGITTTTRS